MSRVLGQWELRERLAESPSGEIWLARDTDALAPPDPVAVKLVAPELASQANFLRPFLVEAKLAAQLSHPNLVQILDLCRVFDDVFIVTELVVGESLADIGAELGNRGRHMAPSLAASLLSVACGALEYAHESLEALGGSASRSHRGLRPSNVLLGYDGQVKVSDFGITAAAARVPEIRAKLSLRRFAYASPEQCLDTALDARSDVFSLGILLWELVVGSPLFDGGTELAVKQAVCQEAAPLPSQRREGVPAELDAIVMRALAKEPANRYASCRELQVALNTFVLHTGEAADPQRAAELLRELFPERLLTWRRRLGTRVRGAGTSPHSLLSASQLADAARAEPDDAPFDLIVAEVAPSEIPDIPERAEAVAESEWDPLGAVWGGGGEADASKSASLLAPLDTPEPPKPAKTVWPPPPRPESLSADQRLAAERARRQAREQQQLADLLGSPKPATARQRRTSSMRWDRPIDGAEPDIFAEADEDELFAIRQLFDVESAIAMPAAAPMTRRWRLRTTSNGPPVTDVIRWCEDAVVESAFLHSPLSTYGRKDGPIFVWMGIGRARVRMGPKAKGWVNRHGAHPDAKELLEPLKTVVLGTGDRARIDVGEDRYVVRVLASELPPRERRRGLALKAIGIAAGLSLAFHVVGSLGVAALDKLGVQVSVEAPPTPEKFAEVRMQKVRTLRKTPGQAPEATKETARRPKPKPPQRVTKLKPPLPPERVALPPAPASVKTTAPRRTGALEVRGTVQGMRTLAKVSGGLSKSDVLAVIGAHQRGFNRCYEQELMASPGLSGKITFQWTILPDGKVSAASQQTGSMTNAAVSTCMLGIIRRMKFPRPTGGSVQVVYPFILRSAR